MRHYLKSTRGLERCVFSEFLLLSKQRRKDIVREVMCELGVGPRQMVRVSGMTYAVIHKLWESH